jgi:hypothetical protein
MGGLKKAWKKAKKGVSHSVSHIVHTTSHTATAIAKPIAKPIAKTATNLAKGSTKAASKIGKTVGHAASNIAHETGKAARKAGHQMEKGVKKTRNAIAGVFVKDKINDAYKKAMDEAIVKAKRELEEYKTKEKENIKQRVAELIREANDRYLAQAGRPALDEVEKKYNEALILAMFAGHNCENGWKEGIEELLEVDDVAVALFMSMRPLVLALQNLATHGNTEALSILLPYFEKNFNKLSLENQNDYKLIKRHIELEIVYKVEKVKDIVDIILRDTKTGVIKATDQISIDGFQPANLKFNNAGIAFSDAGGWNKAQYYETIRTNTINMNDHDQLILTARGGTFIRYSVFDPATNTWSTLQCGPNLADANGWANPQYYKTIRTNVISMNGHDQLILTARGGTHIRYSVFDPATKTWSTLRYGPNYLTDANGWANPQYYETIRTNVMNINGHDQLILTARGSTSVRYSLFDPATNTWSAFRIGPNYFTNAQEFVNARYYKSIRTNVMSINGHDQLILTARGRAGIFYCVFDPVTNIWSALQPGPTLDDTSETVCTNVINMNGHDQLILTAKGRSGILYSVFDPVANTWSALQPGPGLANASETLRANVIVMNGHDQLVLTARSRTGIMYSVFDPVTNTWSRLRPGPELADASGWNKPQYYNTIRTNTVSINGYDQLVLTGRSAAGIHQAIYDHQINLKNVLNAMMPIVDTQNAAEQKTNVPLSVNLSPKWFTELRCSAEAPMDGNCFFRSITMQISNGDASKLRKDVAKHIESNPSMQESISAQGTVLYRDGSIQKSYVSRAQYLQYISEDGAWADHVEITATSEILQKTIVIVHGQGQTNVIIGQQYQNNGILFINFVSRGVGNVLNHYNPLFARDEQHAREILNLVRNTNQNADVQERNNSNGKLEVDTNSSQSTTTTPVKDEKQITTSNIGMFRRDLMLDSQSQKKSMDHNFDLQIRK